MTGDHIRAVPDRDPVTAGAAEFGGARTCHDPVRSRSPNPSFDLATVAETDAAAGETASLARALWLLISEFPLNNERDHDAAIALARVVSECAEATEEAIERERKARHRTPPASQ